MNENNFEEKERVIRERLKKISRRKYQIIWAIFVTLASPFLLPIIRFRRMEKSFAESMGYWNAAFMFLAILIFLMIIVLYDFIDKIKRDKFDAESDLRNLQKRNSTHF